jgi:hypothetical protein
MIDLILVLVISTAASVSIPPHPPILAPIPTPVVSPKPTPQPSSGQTWEQKMLEKYNQRKKF